MKEGPIFGVGWKGLAVQYLASSAEPKQLRRESDELMEAVRVSAEAAGYQSIVVMAEVGRTGGLITHSTVYSNPYERQADGTWRFAGKEQPSDAKRQLDAAATEARFVLCDHAGDGKEAARCRQLNQFLSGTDPTVAAGRHVGLARLTTIADRAVRHDRDDYVVVALASDGATLEAKYLTMWPENADERKQMEAYADRPDPKAALHAEIEKMLAMLQAAPASREEHALLVWVNHPRYAYRGLVALRQNGDRLYLFGPVETLPDHHRALWLAELPLVR